MRDVQHVHAGIVFDPSNHRLFIADRNIWRPRKALELNYRTRLADLNVEDVADRNFEPGEIRYFMVCTTNAASTGMGAALTRANATDFDQLDKIVRDRPGRPGCDNLGLRDHQYVNS
jgi:hypothetical protein